MGRKSTFQGYYLGGQFWRFLDPFSENDYNKGAILKKSEKSTSTFLKNYVKNHFLKFSKNFKKFQGFPQNSQQIKLLFKIFHFFQNLTFFSTFYSPKKCAKSLNFIEKIPKFPLF